MFHFLLRTNCGFAFLTFLTFLALPKADAEQIEKATDGWATFAKRDEVQPQFRYDKSGGPAGELALEISADGREGLDGAWVKNLPVEGGASYRFSVLCKTNQVATPRRSTVVILSFQDEQEKRIHQKGDWVRPEFPGDLKILDEGWVEISETYRVPQKATQARVELHLRWSKSGSVHYSSAKFVRTDQIPERKVRLATVHYRPTGGKTPSDNCKQFGKYIAEAAEKRADLVCLPEGTTVHGTGLTYAEAAEPIPGPSTEYFGSLAKKHDLYIVVGLYERAGHLVYNTAALLGPSGQLVGKYRKVCLPREEVKGGIAPGNEYPVFQTRFGKVGMMICWDLHFPEVARNLSINGAEVIALPIWGGNPNLPQARSIENQIFLVSSTYTDSDRDLMKSGVWDKEGNMLVAGSKWGTVEVVEVDLEKKVLWKWLGNFQDRIHRERPAGGFQN